MYRVNSIFVGNLPFNVREEDLRQAFERFGRVASVRIMTDPSTSQCRGFAFVSMPSLDDADEARDEHDPKPEDGHAEAGDAQVVHRGFSLEV